MKASFRFAVVAVAAFLFSPAPGVVLAAPADQLALHWSELHPVLKGRQLSVRLPDGATVEGRCSSLQTDALAIQVTKTSDRAKHPKGATSLARPEVGQSAVKRHSGWKGGSIGMIVGGAVVSLYAIAENEVGGWSSGAAGAAAAVARRGEADVHAGIGSTKR